MNVQELAWLAWAGAGIRVVSSLSLSMTHFLFSIYTLLFFFFLSWGIDGFFFS